MAGLVMDLPLRYIPAFCGACRCDESICGDTGQAWPLRAVRLFTTMGARCGTFRSGAQGAGAASDAYDLPRTLVLGEDNHSGRFRSVDRLLTDGESVDGWQLDARDVEVSGLVSSDGVADQRDLLRALATVASRDGLCMTLEEGPSAAHLRLARLKQFDRKHVESTRRTLTDVRIRWRVADPSWYEARIHSRRFVIAASGMTTLLFESLTGLRAYPTLHLVAPAAGATGSASVTDGASRTMTYTDTAYLRNGASVVVDSAAGTARRVSGLNALPYMVGTFPSVRPGVDSWRYTGGACTLTLSWQPRWP